MASELEMPDNVKAIVADCPFVNPMDIILYVGRETAFPQWLIKPFAVLGARIYGGFNLLETNAVKAVRKTRVPILIIHGEADRYVPCVMSSEAQLANPMMVRRYTFPGAAHGISYLVDTPRYQTIVKEFIAKVLSK